LIEAFLSAEDKNFYSHPGVDFTGIARAVVTNIENYRAGRRMVGASTITQQVAKNFLLTNDRTFDRKFKEALLALRIEQAFTKDQILELYLNEIFLGLGSYGVAGAALQYFDKSVHELTLAEAAYFAALPKAPNNYHPFRHPERAIERRNWVIDRMVINGFVSTEEAEVAKSQALNVTPRATGAQLLAADYFAEEARRIMLDMYGRDKLYGAGCRYERRWFPKCR
jgi:penicillin-binding protein 1A